MRSLPMRSRCTIIEEVRSMSPSVLACRLTSLFLICFSLAAEHAFAQATSAWDILSASEFLAIPPSDLEAAEQALALDAGDYAWSRFLSDSGFISSESWETIVEMGERFGASAPTPESLQVLRERMLQRVDADPQTVGGVGLFEVGRQASRLTAVGMDELARSDLFAAWMSQNDWESLDLTSLYNLYNWVGIDAVDRRSFSARWSGWITAPQTGAYTLRQLPQYNGTDCRILVRIGGAVALDSRVASEPERFDGEPIQLTGGEPVTISVELTHSVTRIDYSEGAPMIVLTWSAPGAPEKLIPQSAFSVDQSGETPGIRGEYFAGLDFSQSVLDRIDPGLEMAWSWPPTAPKHHEWAQGVLDRCKQIILAPGYLSGRATANDKELFSYLLWRIAYRLTASEREQLVQRLLEEPVALAYLTPQMMGRLYQALYFLPSGEQITLLGQWSHTQDQPCAQFGWFPGWGDDSYQKLNLDFYWLIGKFLQGPYRQHAVELCESYLTRSNGECDLRTAYILSFAGNERDMQGTLGACLQDGLAAGSLNADQSMTWRIAEAYLRETPKRRGRPQPGRGMRSLEMIDLSQLSPDYARWLSCEKAARLAACGCFDQADTIIRQSPGELDQQALARLTAVRDRQLAKEAADLEAGQAALREEIARVLASENTDADTASRLQEFSQILE